MAVKKLTKWPPFLAGVAKKINELVADKISHGDIEAGPGISITDAGPGGNLKIEATGGGGAGLPPGYTFREFTTCVDGTPVTRWWPTWDTNPEA